MLSTSTAKLATVLASVVSAIVPVMVPVGVADLAFDPASDPVWRWPVAAVVSDPFRPPDGPYGAGNRGIEFATGGGEAVRAVDTGTVTWAGTVAGSRFVVVTHPGLVDGARLRSTYAYLDNIIVGVGDSVSPGQVLARAGPGFHLTARVGVTYVDPARFLATFTYGVRLIDGHPNRLAGPI